MITTAETRDVRPGGDHSALLDELYACHSRIFSGVSRAAFAAYVLDAPAARTRLQLVRDQAGTLRGYTAYHEYEVLAEGTRQVVVRMETGMEPRLRGQKRNGPFILGEVLRTCLRYPRTPKFFMAAFVHPSAYIALRRCAPQMWPSATQPTPPRIQGLMGALAGAFGLEAAGEGVYRVGWVTRESRGDLRRWRNRFDPDARFFLARNPRYREGEGLLTLIPLTPSALALGSVRFLLRTVDQAWLTAPSLRPVALPAYLPQLRQTAR